MFERPKWRPVLIAAAACVLLAPSRGLAFLESTTTEGEVKPNLSGVWLVVSHLEFPKASPTPEAGAAAAASPEPSASPAKAADGKGNPSAGTRIFNVVNLLKIAHAGKAGAQAMREQEESREQASIAKAKAILEEEQKKSATIPVQTETGEVEGEPKVIVPTVPPRRQISTDDYADIALLDVEIPAELQASVDKASNAEKAWVPSAKQLAELKASWSTLKFKSPPEYSKIEWKLTAQEKFDDNLNTDPATQGAKFVISGNEEMIPKPGVPKTNVIVFGGRKVEGDVIEGGHVRAMMASAPFPLPIEMKGSFKMYKLVDLPKQGGAEPAHPKPAAKAKKK